MDKTCPFCGSAVTPTDNYCLQCGSKLPAEAPVQAEQQDQDAFMAGSTPWQVEETPAWVASLSTPSASEPTMYQPEPVIAGVQATMEKIAEPARFILRSEAGEILQEFVLEKYEISIGRAPNSDILLSKDKLTSRRHASVIFEENHYLVRDENSANGTFVNGQQLDDGGTHVLRDGDHVGIGEHELVFRVFGAPSEIVDIEELPTVSVPYHFESSFDTVGDDLQTVPEAEEDFSTREEDLSRVNMMLNGMAEVEESHNAFATIETEPPAELVAMQEAAPAAVSIEPVAVTPAPVAEMAPVAEVEAAPEQEAAQEASMSDEAVTIGHLTALAQPSVPDTTPMMAALSSLDGQIMTLQQQLNATQEAVKQHEQEVAQISAQLTSQIEEVSETMNATINEVARSRETLAWAELHQLLEDVMNNPRDIEHVTKLARKAREINKVFSLHQSVLNTMAECNTRLRALISEQK